MSEVDESPPRAKRSDPGLLITVEEVAELWFGEVGEHGSASTNCQRVRRLIPDKLPARRIGNRWWINRTTAEHWAEKADSSDVMAHPATRDEKGEA